MLISKEITGFKPAGKRTVKWHIPADIESAQGCRFTLAVISVSKEENIVLFTDSTEYNVRIKSIPGKQLN